MLNAGAPEIARRQFTRALYTWPADGELYAWRAVAAARTGDQTRASADAESAERLGTKRAAWMHDEISKSPVSDGNPVAMLKAMFEAAKGGADYPALVDSATDLILARNKNRLRLDERYTDQLRELKLAVEAAPQDAAKLAALAAFYYENAVSPRGEAVELRAPWKPYRSVDEADIAREMSLALDVATQALQVDAGNISAMITKAAVLVQRMQFGDAEQFLKDALSRAPSEPRLLRLFAQVADRAAAAKQAQASSLRTPTTWEDQFYIYTRYPSAAERAQADELERQANQLWQMAEQTLRQAVQQAQNAGDRAYFEAVLMHRNGQFAAALESARKAVEHEPENLEYLDMVTTLLVRMDQKVEALLNQARAANLVETTAGPALKCVWFSLPRTKFKTSREYLDQAAAYDAADPRVAAYFGAVAGADERTDIATAWYSVACALYEANARMEGVLTKSDEPSPLRADVAGTMMNVNLRAAVLLRTTRPKDAEYLMRSNLRMQGRIDQSDLFTPIPSSMLPDMDANQIPVPQADHVAYMLSVTRLELGRALLAQKRYDDAIAQFQQVGSYRDMVPPTVDAGSKMQYPIAAAQIWTVSALLDSGRADRAQQLYRQMPRPRQGLDSETAAELQKVMQSMDQARADQQSQEEEQYRNQQEQMLENARNQRQQQIDQINRQRQRQGNRTRQY
jgi:tetratricopeptide (TPR) repeat protein